MEQVIWTQYGYSNEDPDTEAIILIGKLVVPRILGVKENVDKLPVLLTAAGRTLRSTSWGMPVQLYLEGKNL